MDKMKKQIPVFNEENFPYWITDKYIYIMLLVFPLFTGFHGYTQVTLSKYIFFSAVTVIWLAAILICKMKSKIKLDISRSNLVRLFVLLYLFFCCLSAVFSSYKASVFLGEGRFDGLITTLLCLGIFFGVSVFGRPKPAYIYAASISMLLNCIVAILQFLGYNPLHLFPGDYTYYDAGIKFSSIFLGTIGNADLFSAFLCLTLPMVSSYYITAKNRHLSLLSAVVLSAYCVFACGVSGGILALAVCILAASPFVITSGKRLRRALEVSVILGLSMFAAFFIKFVKATSGITVEFCLSRNAILMLILTVCLVILRFAVSKYEFKKQRHSYFLAALSAAIFITGLVVTYFWQGSEGTLYELSQTLHGNVKDKFGSSRILIWRNILKLVPEHLLIGGGPGTLPLRLDISFSRNVVETGKTLSTVVDNAHNDYLGILVNTGLMSLTAYLAAQVISLLKAAKTAKSSTLICCLACSLLCYWMQAFFGLGLFLVSPVMWLVWGLLISYLRHYKKS